MAAKNPENCIGGLGKYGVTEIPPEKLALLIAKIKENAKKEVAADKEDFMVHDWAGGNIDDAFQLGVDAGYSWMASELLGIINE